VAPARAKAQTKKDNQKEKSRQQHRFFGTRDHPDQKGVDAIKHEGKTRWTLVRLGHLFFGGDNPGTKTKRETSCLKEKKGLYST